MNKNQQLRVVLIHDWLTGMRGGEKCLESFARRWPTAKLFTLLHSKGSVSQTIEELDISPSRLDHLPYVKNYYRYLLPLMPFAAGWKIDNADLVLSSSHCVAKSAQAPESVPHICYCFTPMRYAWHMKEAYFSQSGVVGWLRDKLLNKLLGGLRNWDRKTADRVTHFIAISRTVQERIRDCYNRDSVVIYPPVDTNFYTPANCPREDFYLVVSALAPYKRFDLAIEACLQLNKKLVVIGSGQHESRLREQAGKNVKFLGWQTDEVIREHFRRAKALLFPGEEDFGIVPLEAQACGCPVIAYGRGGSTETIRALGNSAEPTGILFDHQTSESLIEAIELFETKKGLFDPRAARRQALLFRKERFENEIFDYIDQIVSEKLPSRKAA